MRFKPIGSRFVIRYLVPLLSLAVLFFIFFFIRDAEKSIKIIIALIFISVILSMVFQAVYSKLPTIVVSPKGIFLEKSMFGFVFQNQKAVGFDSIYVKIRKGVIKIYSTRIKLLSMKCRFSVVDNERASFFQKLFHMRINTFMKFVDEVLKRGKEVVIDKKSFEFIKSSGIELGVNVTVKESFSFKRKKSVLDDFNP